MFEAIRAHNVYIGLDAFCLLPTSSPKSHDDTQDTTCTLFTTIKRQGERDMGEKGRVVRAGEKESEGQQEREREN